MKGDPTGSASAARDFRAVRRAERRATMKLRMERDGGMSERWQPRRTFRVFGEPGEANVRTAAGLLFMLTVAPVLTSPCAADQLIGSFQDVWAVPPPLTPV